MRAQAAAQGASRSQWLLVMSPRQSGRPQTRSLSRSGPLSRNRATTPTSIVLSPNSKTAGRVPYAHELTTSSSAWPGPTPMDPIHHGQLGGRVSCLPTSSRATTASAATAWRWSPAPTRMARRSPSAPTTRAARPCEVVEPSSTSPSSIPGTGMGITFDTFTTTMTDNHREVAQGLFLATAREWPASERRDAGALLRPRRRAASCPTATSRANARIASEPQSARGDQCDTCGRQLDAVELINPRSRGTGATPGAAQFSDHYFLLPDRARGSACSEWLDDGKDFWRTHVINFSQGHAARGVAGPRDHARHRLGRVLFRSTAGTTSASTSGSRP